MEMNVYTAGSFSGAMKDLEEAFAADSKGVSFKTVAGPAGLLAERIVSGERCDLFVSANFANAEIVSSFRKKTSPVYLCSSDLVVVTKDKPQYFGRTALEVLLMPDVRIGTSTPKDDPCGDYTVEIFNKIRKQDPDLAKAIEARAKRLVGGKKSEPVPAGKKAAVWLLDTNRCDAFIGYGAFWKVYPGRESFQIHGFDRDLSVKAEWYAVADEEGEHFLQFICSPEGRGIIEKNGFEP